MNYDTNDTHKIKIMTKTTKHNINNKYNKQKPESKNVAANQNKTQTENWMMYITYVEMKDNSASNRSMFVQYILISLITYTNGIVVHQEVQKTLYIFVDVSFHSPPPPKQSCSGLTLAL